ncbi:hypothetical protein KIAC18_000278 [Sporomusa sphaeroides]|uniref:hypothetical protein n=1 Tax=Sporomusa sphaeroides TaxID=47679 RepID=UPI003DA0A8A2
MPEKLYCNSICQHNDNPEQLCTVNRVYNVDRQCVTYRKRPRGPNYRELMRMDRPNCHKDGGGKYRSSRVSLIK